MSPSTARLDLLHALAAADPAALAAWCASHALTGSDLAWLGRQNLALYLFDRLQRADLLEHIAADVLAPWQAFYHQATAATAAMDWEIEHLLLALRQAGVDFILLKGAALAYTVYANPACRLRGDLDLWVQPEQLPQATATLATLGYRGQEKDDRPDALTLLVGGEQQLHRTDALLTLIELQWPALRGEWLRRTANVDHAGIWRRRTAVAMGQQRFPTMAPEDTLLHLCLHQAINHQFSTPWLRNLLDVHLLLATCALDWAQVTARATGWRLATVVWTTLSLAQRLLGTPAPAAVLHTLAPPPWRQRWIQSLDLDTALLAMQEGGYSHRRFAVQLALVDRARDDLIFLGRGLLPEAVWLRARYGLAPGQPLWRWRLRHIWNLVTAARG